ncbi:hypothetical protein ACFPVV_07115 [Macrococcoides bohemicum]|uniref:Uncharacterized protein n=1 Tax=Macrococcoides bohemicum TaxID=1903056 RepID=A0A328A2H6_9STAP|nr:hypothetical protein [Macrococcus bohemicus]RAK47648.1 hypothetical protein BHX94_12380 [Macrococcus bohemicus]
MNKEVYYYFLKNGEESVIDYIYNQNIIESISYDFYQGKKSGAIIKEVDYTNSNITLWADSEGELRKLIKREKDYWNDFSKQIKKDDDFHYIQFEKLSNQFNINGTIFILNLLDQISYP